MKIFLSALAVMAFSITTLNAHAEVELNKSGLSLHKRNFISATDNDLFSGNRGYELMFQISAKQQLFKRRIFAAYTQKAFWQILDEEHSRPFRETNYNPEIFYRSKVYDFAGGQFFFDAGYEHESNGQTVDRSRSWDRLYFWPNWKKGNLSISAKTWWRFPEDEKETPDSPKGDDNPDIHDFWGRAELRAGYIFDNGHGLHAMTHGNLRTHKGAIELRYTIPSGNDGIHYSIHGFSGYGDSLFDYNRNVNRIGIGVTLTP